MESGTKDDARTNVEPNRRSSFNATSRSSRGFVRCVVARSCECVLLSRGGKVSRRSVRTSSPPQSGDDASLIHSQPCRAARRASIQARTRVLTDSRRLQSIDIVCPSKCGVLLTKRHSRSVELARSILRSESFVGMWKVNGARRARRREERLLAARPVTRCAKIMMR